MYLRTAIALFGFVGAAQIRSDQATSAQLPKDLGPHGALQVECVFGCGGGGGVGSDVNVASIGGNLVGTTLPVSGSISVSNFPATQAVSGSVNIGNFPATQAVSQSGTWSLGVNNFPTGFNVNNFPTTANTSAVSVRCVNTTGSAFESCAGSGGGGGTVAIDQTTPGTTNGVNVNNFPATQAVTQSGTWSNVGVTGTFWQATQPVSGTVGVNNFPASQAVTGTFWPATQDVNNTQIKGIALDVGQGISATGTQRVVLSQEATYSAGTTIKTNTTAGTGPFWNLCGSGTKTVRLQRIAISGTVSTAAVWGDVILKKTSTATSSGTATTLTAVPYDSNSAAATAVSKFYTALGTAGTSVGVILNVTQLFPVTTISATLQPTPAPIIYIWRDQDAEAPTLRGTAQCVEASFGTTTTNAPTLSVSSAWTEK